MNKLLSRLFEGLRDTNTVEPDSVVEKGQVVIGTLEDQDLRRLFTLMTQMKKGLMEKLLVLIKDSEQHGSSSGENHNPKKCPICSVAAEIEVEKMSCEAVSKLLWAGVYSSLPKEAVEKAEEGIGIGLCKNWQIVVLPNLGPSLESILSALPGAMFRGL